MVEQVDPVFVTGDVKVTGDDVNFIIKDVVKPMETIQFWVKTNDRDLEGEQVTSMKIKMAPFRTVGRVKRTYSNKIGLDKNKQEKLHFMFEGRMLEDEEEVRMLNTKTIFAAGLWFK